MQIIYKLLTRNTYIDLKSYHFVFEKVKEFYSKKYNIPPFGGVLKICLMFATYKEVKELQEYDAPNFIHFTIYCKEEVLISLGIDVNVDSPWDTLLAYLKNYPHKIDDKLCKKIYYNIKNPLDVLEQFRDKSELTEEMLIPFYNFDKAVYPIDVLASILSYRRNIEGLLRYSKINPILYINNLTEQLGDEYAFYAVRKLIFRLYKEKLNYLKNEEINLRNKTEILLIKNIDIFEFTFLYTLFKSYKGKSIYVLLNVLNRRKINLKCFYEAILLDI